MRCILLAVDQYDSGQIAVEFTAGLARSIGTDIRVIHVREVSRLSPMLALEAPDEGHALVEQVVTSLRNAGVRADGRLRTLPEHRVANGIVDESARYGCDAIVLGARRLRGLSRMYGRGVREQVLRLSALPVIVAPIPFSTRALNSKGLRSFARRDRKRELRVTP
jgi:nucleotide-binding universal stress UspA family protein